MEQLHHMIEDYRIGFEAEKTALKLQLETEKQKFEKKLVKQTEEGNNIEGQEGGIR